MKINMLSIYLSIFYDMFLIISIVSNGPKKDKKKGDKEQGLQDPKMVHFTGRLTGEIDLKDVEKLKSEAKDAKLRTRRSFFHTRLNKSQLKHLLRSALPTKRILFNEIGKIHFQFPG